MPRPVNLSARVAIVIVQGGDPAALRRLEGILRIYERRVLHAKRDVDSLPGLVTVLGYRKVDRRRVRAFPLVSLW